MSQTQTNSAATAQRAKTASTKARWNGITLVRDDTQHKSEPNPSWFGNPPNPTPGKNKKWSHDNWLQSRFHFNFADYHRGRSNFGPLRVLNDDLVQPKRGFGAHPHANMEIVTYIVSGNLTHKDSMGTAETLTSGDVQFMTAGRGVEHSEHNLHNKPLRFIQMWFVPRTHGLKPNYGSMKGDAARRHNQWHQIVTDVNSKASNCADVPIKINQDVNIFVADLDRGISLPAYHVEDGRQVYLLCLSGSDVKLADDTSVSIHDAAMVKSGSVVNAVASTESNASLLLIDVPSSSRGR